MKIKFKAKLNGKEVTDIADTDKITEVLESYIRHLMIEEIIEEPYEEIEVIGFELGRFEAIDMEVDYER
jgi:F420-0:gamma-glutamyl ligase-like protein